MQDIILHSLSFFYNRQNVNANLINDLDLINITYFVNVSKGSRDFFFPFGERRKSCGVIDRGNYLRAMF